MTDEAQKTLWESIDVNVDIKPKIVFNFNEPVDVTFPADFTVPKEFPSKFGDDNSGTYCVFNVKHKGEEAAIVTSAYSLLRGLKKNMPLANKSFRITKKLKEGKQQYTVEPI